MIRFTLSSYVIVFFAFFLSSLVDTSTLIAQDTSLTATNGVSFVMLDYNEIESKEKKSETVPFSLGKSRTAQFQSGKTSLDQYLQSNVAYPETAREYAIEGTTIIRFRVKSDGTLDHFSVTQSTHPVCDQAVINALQNMPHWTPALYNGKAVATWRQVAVDFHLGL